MKGKASLLALILVLIISSCAKKTDSPPTDPDPEYYIKINIDGHTVNYAQKKQDSLVVRVDGATYPVFAMAVTNKNCYTNGVRCFNFNFMSLEDTIVVGRQTPMYFLSVDFIEDNQIRQYQYNSILGDPDTNVSACLPRCV